MRGVFEGHRVLLGTVAGVAALLVSAMQAPDRPSIFTDDFEEISEWRAAPSSGVQLALSNVEGLHGHALRLDFDFGGRAGWAAARRDLAIDLPENYELSFAVRGEAPANDLEVKLIDSSGDNVWWAVRRDFEPPSRWQTTRLKKRHFSFAWGPAGGGEIRHVAAMEFAVTARAGGRGWIALDELELSPLPPPGPPANPPALTASSSESGHDPARAMDGDPSTAWESAAAGPAWLTIDLGERREYGGLTIQWEPNRFAKRYAVEVSDDGRAWTVARAVEVSNGGRDDLYLPESESRYLRLAMRDAGEGGGYGIREIAVQPLSYSETPNAFFQAIARGSPRGAFPRGFSGQQSYWTVVGVEGDTENGLFSEDGAVEPRAGAFSVEPFLLFDGQLLSWSDVEIGHALEEGDLPIPTVTWKRGPLSMAITALASGKPGHAALDVRYRVSDLSRTRRGGTLFLAVRPLQVNPPTQFLNRPGGVCPIRRLAWDGKAIEIDGARRVFPLVTAKQSGAATFDQGSITEFLLQGAVPPASAVDDSFGYASGAMAFDLDLSGGSDEIEIRLPIDSDLSAPAAGSHRQARTRFERGLAEATRRWRERLGPFRLQGPPPVQQLDLALRSNLAYALVERDGPAIRPGTRAYARSWIRDGAMICAALLRLGRADVVRAYIEWFARFQEPDGRVPCCVDRRGGDPVVENDSHGEWLDTLGEYGRYTADTKFLAAHFDNVQRGVSYIESLRQKRRTEEFRRPDKLAFFGLLPESISHEGYSARPVHSYWDDFWTLTGLRSAVEIAASLGREPERKRWEGMAGEFERDLLASLTRTMTSRSIAYIPGSVELADFDPAATTIALDPAGELSRLPRQPLTSTFERYFAEFRARRGSATWDAYTPYEIRTVGAFARLGWRDRIGELLDFFLAGRRPAPWNQWAEVVGREERKPRFVGDIPHAWVGTDFIRSALDILAYERKSDGALVLAAGIPSSWLSAPINVDRLTTPYGELSYSLRREAAGLRLSVAGLATIPPGGIALRPPLSRGPHEVTVDGKRVAASGEELGLRKLPADVLYADSGR